MQESILVVEDDAELSEALALFLSREGYVVATAGDGIAAVDAAQNHRPDLVLLDLILPRLSGLDVCRRLKADPRVRSIPIIIVSARGEECDVVLGLGLGAEDYIVKPY
ncbi:MAG: response regulator, partial [Planctomycetota bacterium]